MNANLYPLETRLSRSIGSVILQRFFSISFCHSCKSFGFIRSNIRIEPSTFNAEIGALVNGCWTTDGKEGFGWIGRYKKRIAVSITSFKQVLFTLIEATSLLNAITRGLFVSYYITSWSFVQLIFVEAFTRIVKYPTWLFTNSLASMFYIAKKTWTFTIQWMSKLVIYFRTVEFFFALNATAWNPQEFSVSCK